MHKSVSHTISKLVFCWLFFFATATAVAQEAPPVMDTVISQVTTVQDTESYFDKMYDGGPVAARSVPDSTVQRLKKDEDYWYANTAPERQKSKVIEPHKERWYQQKWFANLLWFLLIGTFVAILIWFLASSNIQLFRRKASAIYHENETAEEENIFSLNYEKEIQKAIAHQNFRLAIRLWYLQTLKELADRNIIQYKQERTNSDYVLQLYNTPYHKNFFHLTRNFEYTWYGKFAVSADSFALLQKDFQTFQQQLP